MHVDGSGVNESGAVAVLEQGGLQVEDTVVDVAVGAAVVVHLEFPVLHPLINESNSNCQSSSASNAFKQNGRQFSELDTYAAAGHGSLVLPNAEIQSFEILVKDQLAGARLTLVDRRNRHTVRVGPFRSRNSCNGVAIKSSKVGSTRGIGEMFDF